jgi:hypothetical protein
MRTRIIAALALSTMLVAPAAFAQNSGAGTPGLPGNKSGVAQTPSGSTQTPSGATSPGGGATPQDHSGVPGKPGGKSGPAVTPPSSGGASTR